MKDEKNYQQEKFTQKDVMLKKRDLNSELVQSNQLKFLKNQRCSQQNAQLKDIFFKRMVSQMFEISTQSKDSNNLQVQVLQGKIQRLCMALKKQQRHSGVQYDIFRLFGMIFIDKVMMIEWKVEGKCQSEVVILILQQEILFDLLKIWNDSKNQIRNIYLQKLICHLLIADSSSQHIKQGGFSAYIDKVLTQINQNRFQHFQINNIFQYSEMLVKYMDKSYLKIELKLYFVIFLIIKHDLIFQILNELTLISQSLLFNMSVIQILSITFRNFLFKKGTQQENLYINFSKHKSLFFKVLKLSFHHQISVKNKAWTILALLSSIQNEKVQRIFQQHIFFNILVDAEKSITNNYDQLSNLIREKIVLCIGNLADYGDQMKKLILRPQIIKVLIDSILQRNSQKLKFNGYYALINLLNTSNPILLNESINTYPLPDLLIHGLICSLQDDKLVSEIFKALNYLIEKDKTLKRKESLSLQNKLQAKYSISTILKKTQNYLQK